MRVIYFSGNYGPHDHRFLSGLAGTRHEVFYLRLERGQRQLEDRPVPAGIEQPQWAGGRRPFKWKDVPKLVVDLRRVVQEVKPDLIHAGPIQTSAFISVLSGFRPILTMSWGFDLMQDAERDGWWRWVTGYTLRRSTFFTSDARVTRARAVQYGMRADRTSIFPWGVDLDAFKPVASAPTKRFGRAGGALSRHGVARARTTRQESFVLLCNRSWEPRYGVDVLAAGFAKAAARHPRLFLLLLGGGSQAEPIRSILQNAGVIDKVRFGGQVPYSDLIRWYHMADIFISPSHVDGSSVSLMEALACGVPALVSDIPANKEWVREGVNGWLFPDGDADALAQRILATSSSKSQLATIGRAARKVAEKRADWGKNFRVLMRAYERTVKFK